MKYKVIYTFYLSNEKQEYFLITPISLRIQNENRFWSKKYIFECTNYIFPLSLLILAGLRVRKYVCNVLFLKDKGSSLRPDINRILTV